MDPHAVTLIERAKRAIATRADDPRTPALVAEAKAVLDKAQPWQDVAPIVDYR